MEARTWHHGIVARWWAEFNVSGPEIDFFRQFVEDGQPALDTACGTGRLLLPYLRAGFDVDGCDISPDMLALCREQAEREGLSPNLYAQALHELDLPRRYRTILVCGGFGLGSTREQDREALLRLYEHLEPGGTLALDNQAPHSYVNWLYWPNEPRRDLPQPWPASGDRRSASDGAEYELRTRLVALDPLSQRLTLEMRAAMWREGDLVAEEEHILHMTIYFTHELVLMLERAGFVDVEQRAGYRNEPPTADDEFVVFVAHKPSVVS